MNVVNDIQKFSNFILFKFITGRFSFPSPLQMSREREKEMTKRKGKVGRG